MCPTPSGPPREHSLIMPSRRGIRQKASLARFEGRGLIRTTKMGIPQSCPGYGHFKVKKIINNGILGYGDVRRPHNNGTYMLILENLGLIQPQNGGFIRWG